MTDDDIDQERQNDLVLARALLRMVEAGVSFYEACEYYVSVDVLAARLGKRVVANQEG